MNLKSLQIFKRHLLLEKTGYKSCNINNSCEVRFKDGKHFFCKLLQRPSMSIPEDEYIGYTERVVVNRPYRWDNLEFVLCRASEESTNVFYEWLRESTDCMNNCNYHMHKKELELRRYTEDGTLYEIWYLSGSLVVSCQFNDFHHNQERGVNYIEYPSELKCEISFDRASLKI